VTWPCSQGIVVFGYEYFFGGGIQKLRPEMVPTHFGAHPIRSIVLGNTSKSQRTFEEFLEGIRPRFTAETYNLLHHNCNNFSDECAKFLLGRGIPQEILDVPRTVLSTPLGQMFAPMLSQMSERMSANLDPFAGAAAAPPVPPPPTMTEAQARRVVADAGSGERSSFIAALSPVEASILAVNKTMTSSGSALSDADASLLHDGCQALLAEFGKPDDAEGARERLTRMIVGGRWPGFHTLALRILKTWPDRVRPAALFLVRCSLLREDGASALASDTEAMDLVQTWLSSKVLSGAALAAAFGLCQNAVCAESTSTHFCSESRAPAIIGSALETLQAPGVPEQTRQSCAMLLFNLACKLPPGSDGLSDQATSLLLGVLELLGAAEADSEVLKYTALAVAKVLVRGGDSASALALSMDASAVLGDRCSQGGVEARALECLRAAKELCS
jgi:hypothetical protein